MPGNGVPEQKALRDDIRYLADEGIRYLVSLEHPSGHEKKACEDTGLQWSCFPVPDFNVPEDEDAFRYLVRNVTDAIDRGLPVCVHCRAGIGRTGMALSCIVGEYLHLPAGKAVASVRRQRSAIETDEQMEFITLFLRHYET